MAVKYNPVSIWLTAQADRQCQRAFCPFKEPISTGTCIPRLFMLCCYILSFRIPEEREPHQCFSCESVLGTKPHACNDPVDVTKLEALGAICSPDIAWGTCYKTVTRYEKLKTRDDQYPGVYSKFWHSYGPQLYFIESLTDPFVLRTRFSISFPCSWLLA